MKTFYRIFGGKRVRRALVLFALVSSLQAISQPCSIPTEAFLTGNATICQGSTTDILINISGGVAPWRVIYSINGAFQPEITGIMSSPYTVSTGTAGDYMIEQVLDADDCTGTVTGSPVTIQVNPFPAPAGLISGNTVVCQSTNGISYSVPAISNATGYTWALPSGASIASGNNTNAITVNFSSSASSGNISVYGTNSCGNGAPSGLFVTVSTLPGAAGVITGSASVCQGQSGLNYSVSPVSGAISYEWVLPAGATITSGANSNSITASYSTSATSGPVSVRGVNSCGNGTWSPDLQVTVNQLPGNPGLITGSSAVCQGQTGVTFSVPAIALASGYEWILPTGASIISGANTNQITVNFSTAAVSGDILVRGLNGCGAGQWSAAFAVTVSNLPLSAGNITGPALVCSDQTNLVFSITPVAYAAGYEWQYPAGFAVSGPANGSTLTLNASGATAGIIRARAVNACGNGAWSPDFSIAIHPLPAANAGPDAQICATANHSLTGSASDYSSVNWSSSGSGSFVNQHSLSATYIPSPADIAAGSVVLTLTATAASPCNGSAADQMILTLLALPVVNAGPDFSSCSTSGVTLNGSSASNYGSLLWTTSGSGSFSNPATLHPVYTPDATDVASGSVTLTLTAFGNAGCAGESVSDQITLFINPSPVANAGNAAATCEGESYAITDATASNYATITWSSSGTGTFINNGTLNPTYTPSLADAINGSVNLTLTATPLAPCLGNATSVKTLSITRQALANAGPDGSNCGSTPFTLSSASASNYSSLLWTSSGSGSFVNPGILNATYIPGAGDLVSGTATLTLTLTGNSPCATPVSDDMVLSIGGEPSANAGIDGQTCETTPFTVTTATATNYSVINWTTSGTGILSDAGSLTPTYTPSNADALSGIVTLTMTVTGQAPCTATITDMMQIAVIPAPLADAGTNFSVCGGNSFTVTGASAQYYSSVNWTSSGSGTLVDANQIDPTYTPSAADIANGAVTLTLTAMGNVPCVAPVVDALLVTINQIPSVFAGNDLTICEGPHNVTGAVATNYSSLMWTSSGDGVFINPTSLTPIYTPGPGDLINGLVTLTLSATSLPPCTDIVSDDVILTIRPLPQVFAGPNANVCEGSTYELINATASNYTSLTWSTSGSGNFNNINTLNPVYTPSLADIANGAITLTLTATNPPCQPQTSDMTLNIRQNPEANAGTDAPICEGDSYTVNNATATNSSSVMWTSTGSGTLLNPTTLTPTYIPSAADIMIGSVQLTMTAYAVAPCIITDTDVMEITITNAPTAFAGNDATICANQSHTIVGSTAGNYSSLAWSTSGDGVILAANTLYPTYVPGIIDESLGFAILTLTAYGVNPCTGNATDQMMLTVVSEPEVDAGPDIQICVGSNVPLTGASAQSVSSVYWSTSGSGSFSDPTLVNPVYTPSPQDITNGSVILMITGQGVAPCSSSTFDIMNLQISQPPVVDAGSDGEICETGSYYIFDASAIDYSAITWTTMGDGVFSNHNSINPTYTPGPADIAAGSVLLYLNATSLLPCSGSVSDAMLLTIHPMPIINAGADAATCEGDTYLLSGATALDYSSLQWTTSGSGWFSNNAALNPIYTPSATDIINGSVTLTLTATGLLPCSGQVTDQMVLTIEPQALANAGADETICVGTFTITTASASNYSTLQWVSNGTSGTLLNANTITPTYMPSPADIAAGSVVLTLTATPNTPCAVPAVDQTIITIRPLVEVNAGADVTICETSDFTPNTATATNYNNILWTSSGTGSFINANTLTPTYTPSPADIALGWVTLTISGTSIAPCNQTVSDNMTLTIRRQAVVDAGISTTICETATYQTSPASAINHTSLLWSTSGTGVFADPTILVTTYTSSAADIANGSVLLTLTATSMAPCIAPISDFMVLTIQEGPQADAGIDAAICENESYNVTTATAGGYSGLVWTTSGNGSFVDGTTLNPTYTPGTADIAAGSVILTLTANASAPCTGQATDSFILTVNTAATADAGADASVCEGTGLVILDATADNYSTINWTTSGTGSFSNGSTLSPTYFPSPEDVTNGTVILTLTAASAAPCTLPAVDTKVVTVFPMPEVNAGPDGISCGMALYNITGATASDYASLLWTTSGSGVFTNATALNPSYQPSAADVAAGSVTLTLTAISTSPCPTNPADSFVLTLEEEVTANAGADASVCEGDTYMVFDAAASNYAAINWTHNGSGVLVGGNSLTPAYTPSTADALAGSVTLQLTAIGNSPCGDVTDTKNITVSPLPLVNAGPDATNCFGSGYTLSLATAQHYSSVLWSTSGSGTFSNPALLNPVYTPSAADLLAGQVILTVSVDATAPCTGSVSDFMILMFEEGPLANAGADATICEGSVFTVSTASASNYLSLMWKTSGDGSFVLANTLTPTYTPGTADLLTGFVTLTLSAYGNPPCTEHSDEMLLTFAEAVTANAGTDVTICEGETVIVADASAQHYNNVLWTSSGSGILNNETTLTPTYNPSAADISTGSVVLTLTVFGQAPCGGSAFDSKLITIIPAPRVNAGPDATLCEGSSHTISGATASGTSSLNWTSSGSGSFSGNGTLTPTYTPSVADFTSGSVTLTLTGNAISPCSAPATDAMILTLVPAATVNAGTDATICETQSYTVSAASATNYSSIAWTSSGSGTLSGATTLTPTYTPSAADITTGSVMLTLTAISGAPCSNPVSDQMIITIDQEPEAYAGADATICEGQQHTITGATASTGLIFSWMSSGTGTFLNQNTLTPTYIPSAADVAAGSVTLSLSVQGTGACNMLVTDDMELSIDPMVIADAGADATICEGLTHTLSDASAANYASVTWTTSGSGSFTNPAIVNATYNPSAADIANGSVVLNLQATAAGVCSGSVSDLMTLTFNTLPVVNAGPDVTSCDAAVTLSGATASNYSSLLWTSSGTGTLSNATTLSPTYVPGAADFANGFVDLTLTAQATTPCAGSSSDVVRINLNQGPEVNAGNDGSICAGNTFAINGASAIHASLITWSTSGSGTFSNSNIINPVYTPGAGDIANGSVVLTLTGSPVSPCSTPATDQLLLNITPVATAFAGTDDVTCSSSYLVTGATATNYSSFTWTSSGSGSFINQTTLTPTYLPSAADVANGSVVLTLEVMSNAPCTQLVTDSKLLTLMNEPLANAGVDASVCEGSTYMVTTATASNYSTLSWSSSGSGSFSGQNTINPVYTPSATDIANGSVTLTLTATAASPCSNTATDQMVLTIQNAATANAGNDASICEGDTHTLSGSVSNSTLFSWNSSGTGTFANGSTLSPVYTPSATDITAGSVTITLTAFATAPCSTPATDIMVLTFTPQPQVFAGADAVSCSSDYTISDATAISYNTLSWSTSGTGTFINPGSINPTYVASLADISSGSVILTLTATGNSPCTSEVSDALVLSFAPVPTVSAGDDDAVCGNNSYTLTGASAVNYSTITWSTSGSGTFSNTTLVNPEYYPSAADVASGSVVLTITAASLTPCNTTASGNMTLTFNLTPQANAGPNANSCGTASYQVTGATASNYATIYWTHNGTGTISGANTISPVYTPSQGDVTNGQVTLTLHATAIAPCTGEITSDMIINLQAGPLANAGADVSVCEGQSYTLSGATASGYATLLWSTSGSGTFSNNAAINPVYYPSADDISNGSVTLTLTLQGAPPCNTVAADYMVLTIQGLPFADAGADDVACGSSYQLINASAANYSSVNWTSSGTGFFSNSALVNPVYTPSAGDIATGSVTLTLTATGVSPCNNQTASQMVLTIGAPVTASAGVDGSTCGTTPFTVSTSSASNYSGINWTTSGSGTFANQNSLNPTYTPSAGDVALGAVTLTMHVQGNSPCFTNLQDNMLLTILNTATAYAGPDAQVCNGSNYTVTGATATSYAAISWSTTGTGTLVSGNTLSPTYIPSTQDYINGNVILTLTAVSSAPCSGSVSDEMVITFADGPLANAGPDAEICFGTNYNVTGATASGYTTLNWTSSGTGTLVNATSLTPTYIPSNADRVAGSVNLTLTAQGAVPCFGSHTDAMTLTISSLPTDTPVVSGPQDVCAGQTGVVYSVIPVQYATSYNWILPSGATIVAGAYTSNIVVDFSMSASSGNIFVTALSACGSSPASAAFPVTVSPLPGNPGIIMGPDVICQNTSGVTYSINPVNGTTAYQWTVPAGATIAAGSGTNTITVDYSATAVSGDITVTPQNACGSGNASVLAITVNPMPVAPVISANGPVEFCEGGSVELMATAGYAAYLWSNGETTQNITVTTSGIYSVTVTDPAGCASLPSNEITVNVHMLFVPDITASGPTSLCEGESVTLSAPAGYASYLWNNGETSQSITVTTSGVFNVIVTDAIGCTSLPSADVSVTVNPLPATPVIVASGPLSFCEGGSVTLSAPAGYASYLWSNGETTQSILVVASGVFSVSVGNLNGCSSMPSAAVTVDVHPYPTTPVITASGPTTFCNGGSVELSATAGYTSYLWSNGETTQSITVSISGTYTVTVTDDIGCTSQPSAPIDVNVLQVPAPVIVANGPVVFCNGDSVVLSAPAGYAAYLWSNGETTQQITVTLSGSYSAQVTDNNGCISEPSNAIDVNVYAPAVPPVITASGPTTICEGESVLLSAPAGYTGYTWSNGETNHSIVVSTPGDYYVTITDVNGCTSAPSNIITVSVTPLPQADAGDNASICAGSGYTISGASAGNYSSLLWTSSGSGYFVNNGFIDATYVPSPGDISTGSIILTLSATGVGPCTMAAESSMLLTIVSAPTAYAGPDFNICGGSNVDITLATAGNYESVSWSGSGSGIFLNENTLSPTYIPSATDISNGFVSLVLTAWPASPCATPATDALMVTIGNAPQVFAGDNTSLCPPDQYTTLSATASNYTHLLWTSNGTGAFSDAASLVTVYTPSATDLSNGSVTLTLTAYAGSPCLNISDDIVLIFVPAPAANAGPDQLICEGDNIIISGSASGFESVYWSTSGSGTMVNGNTLTPTYIPSMADINTGWVTLTLTANPLSPCTAQAIDDMQLTIERTPQVYAGADAAICPPGAYTINDATAANHIALQWTSSGSGSFSSNTNLVTSYTPSPADLAAGNVTLTLTAYAGSPCSNASDEVVLYFVPEASANAGPDAVICQGSQFVISGATAANYSGLNWTTSGAGTFINNGTLTPTYIPDAADISNGMVILTLTATPVAPCSVQASDALILTINNATQVNAGPNGQTCYGENFYLADATASNYNSILWTTSGTGSFSNPAEVNATYMPSAADVAAGNVTLTLTAYGNSPCSDQSDFMVLSITPGATVDAGDELNICFGPAPVTGASASNYASLQWTVSFGTGMLVNAGNIIPTYIPGAADLTNGYVILTLTADPIAPCTNPAADNKTLTISETPLVDAGLDETICEGSVYTINDASASNYALIQWSSSGSGTWVNVNTLNPTYTPSAADIAAGSVVLTLTATNGACPAISDYKQLNIQSEVMVNAGMDDAICEGSSYMLMTASAAGYSNLLWSTSGSGTFSNVNALNPEYIPGPADIAAGSVVLTLTGISSMPCSGSDSDDMTLFIRYAPVADAGTDGQICQGEQYIIADAIAYDYASVIWTSTGTGSFINGSTVTPTYIPSPADITAGSVTLTLVASNPPCADANDSQSLTIVPLAQVNAGPDATICKICSHTVSGASVSNALNFAWTSIGTGTFVNGNTLTPTYQPSAQDISNGSVTLILTAESASGCGSYSDEMVIYINQTPDIEFTWSPVCAGQPTDFVVDPTVTDINAIAVWHWNFGDGFYSNEMNPTHTFPAPGVYNVTLTATDTSGYSSLLTHIVEINSTPIAFFSFDTPNCMGESTQFHNLSSTENGYITRWVWNYGDGSATDTIYFPNDPNVEHTYANPGIFEVTLNVLNSYGCENTWSTQVTVTPNPVANFHYTTVCEDLLVNFTDASFPNGAGNIVSWSWNFDDPASGIFNTSDLEDPQHLFSAPGTYNVTLTVTNFNNCTGTITKEITVGELPPVEFTWETSCAESLTSFFADATVINVNTIADYLWEFGDGGQSNLQDPQHMYAAAGDYTVVLTVTDTAGCSNSVSHLVSVSALPVAFFSFSEPTCFETTTIFNDLSYASGGYITEWEWIFGDGNSTTVTFPGNPNVEHQYANAGVYNVTLNITTSEGCENTVTRQVEVAPNPVANFDAATACLGEPVVFTDLSQTNGGGNIVNWAWDFGDPTSGVNNTSTLQNPSHTYAQPGTYTVSLIVTTTNTCADTTTMDITIAPAPAVDFVFTNACSNDTIQFTSSTFVNPATTLSWFWEFGDGTTSVEADPQHIYATHGIFTVSLTITDDQGCTATAVHPVSVVPGPQAMFGFNAPACSGSEVQFNDLSVTNGSVITSWFWDFGDGNTQLVTAPGNPNVSHVYASAGVYTVTLTITNLQGCDASASMNVVIVPGPVAEFTFDEGCQGTQVAFTDLTATNGGTTLVQWLWNFGDPASGLANTSNMQHPVHIFNTAGTYTVTLEATSASGCISSVQHDVVITPPPAVAFIISSGTCVSEPVTFEPDTAIMDLSSIASFEWNFGDGTPVSNVTYPVHVYNVAGSFQVTLTVFNNDGCSNSITQTVNIGAIPVAAFSFVSGCTGNTTSFSDLSYAVTGEQIISWFWNFNDPNAMPGTDTSTLQHPEYHYSAQGLYDVTLTVTSESGCQGSITMPVQIFPAPVAAFTYTTNACSNGSVYFQDASSSYMGAITNWDWTFAPGYTSTLQHPHHNFYHTDSCYNVQLIVTDMRGCVDTLVQEVCIPAGLQVEIEHSVTCHGDTTLFNPVLIAPAGDSLVEFQWNFDDAASGIHNTSTLRNPAHFFQNTGSYLVSLVATDINNCQTTVYKRVEVLELPVAAFSYTAGSCDSTIYFNDLSNGNGADIVEWIWNYGDGTSDTLTSGPADTSHFYHTSGVFEVSLTTITLNGCQTTITQSVERMPCISAVFASVDTLSCERHALTFEDYSVCGNPIDRWEWIFGDGDTLVYNEPQPSVTHTYQMSGSYHVSLIVSTTVSGKTVSDTTTITVNVLTSPIAQFFAPDVCLNSNTIYTDQSEWTGSKIDQWFWDFGDPNSVYDTTSARNPAYRYDRPGVYNTLLTVTNILGCTDTISRPLKVHNLPVAGFNYSLACQNNHTLFTDLTETGDTLIEQWWWRFSDSLNMLGLAGVQNPHFVFENTGTYNVELIVVDNFGCSDTVSSALIVNPKPISAFSLTENYENTQGRVLFTNGSIGATAYEWDFNTGIQSFEIEPVIDFPGDGTYEVTLVSINEFGCPDTLKVDYNLMFKGLWVPNAFSPNNPNAAVRLFKPVGINLSRYTIEVYDTWGNILWTSSELDANGAPAEGWNGVFNGNLLPQDTYMWKATAIFKDGTIWRGNDVGERNNIPEKTYGTVTLIR